MANEKWLIDVNEFKKLFWSKLQDLKFIGPLDVEHIILNTPKVDAVEVVHGRWESVPASTPDGWRNSRTGEQVYPMCCSVCGDVYMNGPYKYCPSCGARMGQ